MMEPAKPARNGCCWKWGNAPQNMAMAALCADEDSPNKERTSQSATKLRSRQAVPPCVRAGDAGVTDPHRCYTVSTCCSYPAEKSHHRQQARLYGHDTCDSKRDDVDHVTTTATTVSTTTMATMTTTMAHTAAAEDGSTTPKPTAPLATSTRHHDVHQQKQQSSKATKTLL
ncbi:hypothetical protein PTSG_12853 [Salpingoeca rosetta]|uniref:Uncharacterized protein n=1 Tax=Salpingoeca rosetta (strain ATCC 50818 / BSB-021) TaxID=946362 RepID=F2UN41_SALR5|nr:uncharacterized protein PTSG_12853 [Salpingoeca rosetta]EGD78540.1 hypothetical protein PTSG_12853 [Salpingoeca rosetta]|eukprot:XP_004989489.1 hypothetical protein PTSG_12853 [Salpingoeca rosetta]